MSIRAAHRTGFEPPKNWLFVIRSRIAFLRVNRRYVAPQIGTLRASLAHDFLVVAWSEKHVWDEGQFVGRYRRLRK